MVPGVTAFRIGEAADLLGVSVDTVRRWSDSGKLRSHRDARNRRRVSAGEVERLSRTPRRHQGSLRRIVASRNRITHCCFSQASTQHAVHYRIHCIPE